MSTTNLKRANLKQEVRDAAEGSLLKFIQLVAPHRVLGSVHEDIIDWWTREEAKDNQLLLLPRDHQKSALIAYRVAWWITKYPDTTVLYVSATADLAEKQLKFIQDIFTSDVYRYYWPEMVNRAENKRTRWTAEEINVDHPIRRQEGVRDATLKAVGLTANTTGLHCRVAVLDDVVVPGNAYTELGRDQVKRFYSQLSSIETTGAKEWVVGTRYHPNDLYKELIDMEESYYDETLDEDVEVLVYETFERQVEHNGEFIWPKQRRYDGKTYGFDERELARKKAKYLDVTQFYAQYYNNPNAVENAYIDRSKFLYYERNSLRRIGNDWYLSDKILNIYAAVDFAYVISDKADYTTIVVIGVDENGFIYVLDIARFRTNQISRIYTEIVKLHDKWKFKALRTETTVAQELVAEQLKTYLRQNNKSIVIDKHRPKGKKEERIQTVLEPRYNNGDIFHYKGGHCQTLEEELIQTHPEHDDIKDALASVVPMIAIPNKKRVRMDNVIFSSRFGGVSYAR